MIYFKVVDIILWHFSGGCLVDILKSLSGPFDPETIIRLFYQTCRAVAHMHSQTPAIIHRDLKIENVLISNDGNVKLCDFGSATVDIYTPDVAWSANQRSTLEENVMIDFYFVYLQS